MKQEQDRRRLIVDAVVLGVAGALAAQIFAAVLGLTNALFLEKLAKVFLPEPGGAAPEIQQVRWMIPVITTVGGLIVGFLVQSLAPEAEGHGTDTAVRAFHRAAGFLRPRVAPIKAVASAITIGTGGAAGREGPIALISAGVGSWYSGLTGRKEAERRLLLVIGMSAGLSATFRSPVGTALFAIEVLYSDMEYESGALLYGLLASIVAYAINGLFVGWQPLFLIPQGINHPEFIDYASYAVLGVGAGLVATLLPLAFYHTRDLFRKLPIKEHLKPAVGGLLTGLIALGLPQILGGGYGVIQDAIDGRMLTTTLAILIFAKTAAMSLTVASGGSGGVFAPSLYVGAMLGGLFAALFHQPAAPFVVVGMAAVFAGSAHVPLATLIMVTEMTGGYVLLVPAALAVTLSYLVKTRVGRRFPYTSLYEAQVPSRADSPAHHTEHLQIALRILQQRNVNVPESIGNLNLLTLLRSGIPVELPDQKRLTVGVIKAESKLAGVTFGSNSGIFGENTDIIGLIRGEHMMAVRPDTVLETGDRLILLTTQEDLERLADDLERW